MAKIIYDSTTGDIIGGSLDNLAKVFPLSGQSALIHNTITDIKSLLGKAKVNLSTSVIEKKDYLTISGINNAVVAGSSAVSVSIQKKDGETDENKSGTETVTVSGHNGNADSIEIVLSNGTGTFDFVPLSDIGARISLLLTANGLVSLDYPVIHCQTVA